MNRYPLALHPNGRIDRGWIPFERSQPPGIGRRSTSQSMGAWSTVRVEREDESFARRVEIARRAVEGGERDALHRRIETIARELVGLGGARILRDELSGVGAARELGTNDGKTDDRDRADADGRPRASTGQA